MAGIVRSGPATKMSDCAGCGSNTVKSGHTAYVIDRDGSVAVVREVPADICLQCGEEYFAAETAQAVYDQAEHLLAGGDEVAVTTFAA